MAVLGRGSIINEANVSEIWWKKQWTIFGLHLYTSFTADEITAKNEIRNRSSKFRISFHDYHNHFGISEVYSCGLK